MQVSNFLLWFLQLDIFLKTLIIRAVFVLGLNISLKGFAFNRVSRVKEIRELGSSPTPSLLLCASVAGVGRAAGRGEAERRSRADLCQQTGPADRGSGLGDRWGTQPAHHPRSDVADPVLLRPHRWGGSGEQMFYFYIYSIVAVPTWQINKKML